MGRWSRTWVGIALAALGGAAGCRFDGEPGVGYRCEVNGDCPPGQVCTDGTCGLGGGGGGNNDGGTGGGTPDAATLDASPPVVGEELVENGDMEEGTDGWTPYNAEIEDTEVAAHDGEQSLEVCNEPTADAFTVYQDIVTLPIGAELLEPGTRYRAHAYVSALPAGLDPPPLIYLGIRERGGAAPLIDHDGPPVMAIPGQWTRMEVSAEIEEPGRDTLILIIWGEGPSLHCFLVDSVSAAALEQ